MLIRIGEDSVTGWLRDPRDESRPRGILMTRSEDPAYDEAFPLHPLSEARKLVQVLVDSNYCRNPIFCNLLLLMEYGYSVSSRFQTTEPSILYCTHPESQW